jgi:cupin fold WbuC family metalloprotein
LYVIFFDDDGKVTRRIEMGPVGSNSTFFYRLSSNLWHTVVPLSDFVIIHETTGGPFIKEESEFAPWSPVDGDRKKVEKFVKKLRQDL